MKVRKAKKKHNRVAKQQALITIDRIADIREDLRNFNGEIRLFDQDFKSAAKHMESFKERYQNLCNNHTDLVCEPRTISKNTAISKFYTIIANAITYPW